MFPNSNNNAIYADIKRGRTQFVSIICICSPSKLLPMFMKSTKILTGLMSRSLKDDQKDERSFKAQQEQAEIIMNHKRTASFRRLFVAI